MKTPIQPHDTISLGSLTRVGLGYAHNAKNWIVETTASGAYVRTAMVVLGTALLACGASPELFQQGFRTVKGLDWRRVGAGILRAAEYSRWFYTMVMATRDLHGLHGGSRRR
ncbi:uncharacterized protein C8A04DRAFT_27237 [Dichotomopilus funicola]|uniref:Uncharacterized protein n=1 Tax=Dichotomopilus funicola TaxID=1934379 RepID=A0AAN6V563_9PEZI|nr:hypothetical protein C8A04DRAFT_27237 [Dichotomopilus funicola]